MCAQVCDGRAMSSLLSEGYLHLKFEGLIFGRAFLLGGGGVGGLLLEFYGISQFFVICPSSCSVLLIPTSFLILLDCTEMKTNNTIPFPDPLDTNLQAGNFALLLSLVTALQILRRKAAG